MAAKDWQTEAEQYAATALALYPYLSRQQNEAMFRLLVETYKMGAISGIDRAAEIAHEEIAK